MTNEEVAATLAEHSNRIKVSEHRIDDLKEKTDRIESLTLSVQKLAISVEAMAKEQIDYRQKQNDLAEKLLEIERKPDKDKAKKLDGIAEYILFAIMGALISYLLYTFFGI